MEITGKQKAAFGFGAFGKDVVYMLIATYLLNYYNVVLKMDSVFIGIVMMGARVFDAFNDPIMGIIVAKTRSRWGRFRPWILSGTVLNAFVIYALFAVPASWSPSGAPMKTWLAVFYVLWGVTYTFMDIPFWSMIPAVTVPGRDRENLTSIARTCSGIGDAIPTVLTNTVVPILSGLIAGKRIASGNYSEWRSGYIAWAIIIAAVFVISEIIMTLSVSERSAYETKTQGVGDMFKALFKNDQAMTVVLSIIWCYTSLNICVEICFFISSSSMSKMPALIRSLRQLHFLGQVIMMMVIPLLRRRFSKNSLYLFGFVLQIAGFVTILIMAYTGVYTSSRWQILCLPGIMVYAGYGILNVIMTIFLSDSVDYGEYKNGSRDESVIFSMQTFTVKLASGIAVALAGVIIKFIGLNTGDGAVQTASTISNLRLFMTIPSVILLIIGLISYKAFYKLDDRKMDEISKALEEKHHKG